MSEQSKKEPLAFRYDSDLSFPYNSVWNPDKRNSLDLKGDKEVWKMFRSGDDEVFGYIYMKYANLLFKFGLQYIKEREILKDCIQDVFISLKKNRRNLTSDVLSIKSYLYKAMYRQVMERIKREKRQYLDLSIVNSQGFDISISEESRLISEEYLRERIKQIKSALGKLSKKQKQAILHYYYDGLTHQEIAYVMEMKNKSSARKLIYRALHEIRENVTKKTRSISLVLTILLVSLLFHLLS